MSTSVIRLAWRLWAFLVWPVPPPPGISVVFVGLLAAILSLWQPKNRWGRAALVFAFAGLSGLEIWAISHDRREQDRQHREDIININEHFAEQISANAKVAADVSDVKANISDVKKRLATQLSDVKANLAAVSGKVGPQYELKRDALSLSADIIQLVLDRSQTAPQIRDPSSLLELHKYNGLTGTIFYEAYGKKALTIRDKLRDYRLDTGKLDRQLSLGFNHPANVLGVAYELKALALQIK